MFCPECGAENEENTKFCEKCGSKLISNNSKKGAQNNKKGLMIAGLTIIGTILFILAIGAASDDSDDSSSDVLTGQLTENQYVSAVNNWTEKLDTVGPVTEGDVVFKEDTYGTSLEEGLMDLEHITPPAKYASYNAIFKQAVKNRADGLNDMYEGQNQGDHALYDRGKALVTKSASEFKSISNQTEEITTWN